MKLTRDALRAQANEAQNEVLEVQVDGRKVLHFRPTTDLRPEAVMKMLSLAGKADEADGQADLEFIGQLEDILKSTLSAKERPLYDSAEFSLGEVMAIFRAWTKMQGFDSEGNS